MERVLFVGDVHATPEELDDCTALMGLVYDVARSQKADRVCLLADNYHTHNIIRAEVMAFWRDTFRRFVEDDIRMSSLVGNHDFAGEGSTIHAMMAHEHVIQVIDEPWENSGVLYLPYHSDRDLFLVHADFSNARTMVCHQTIDGSKYENGFYSTDGVDPTRLHQKTIISGHIHTPQTFVVPSGPEVTYIGAPRWRTLADANIERAIWLYEFDDVGGVVSKTPFDTGTVCRQIRFVTDTPDALVTLPLAPGIDWRVDVRGPADFVERRKAELAGPGVRLRTFKTERKTLSVRESEGIDAAFKTYLGRYTPKYGTPIPDLVKMSGDRLGV